MIIKDLWILQRSTSNLVVNDLTSTRMNPGARQLAERALYKRLVISYFDLMEARSYIERLLGLNGESRPLAEDRIQIGALMTALVVSYGRLFSSNRSGQGVSSALPDRFVRGLAGEERQIHDRLIQLRNQEFAHSDPEPSGVKVHVRGKVGAAFAMPVSNRVRIGLEEHELGILNRTMTRLYEQIYDKMRELELRFEPGERF